MRFNAPTVLAFALAVAQVGLGLSVAWGALRALRSRRRARDAAEQDAAEIERLRPTVAATALLAVVAVSYPALIAVLSSLVGEWPGAMCIEGITRIGERSRGAAGLLPALLDTLLVAQPLLVLIAAAWAVSHAVDRRAAGRPDALGPRLLATLGVSAVLAGGVLIAYLAIPKIDDVMPTGCCLATPAAVRSAGTSWLEALGAAPPPKISIGLLVGALAGLVVALVQALRSSEDASPAPRNAWRGALLAAALTTLLAQHVVVGIASPHLHGVATHRCAWCVIENLPTLGASVAALVCALAVVPLGAFALSRERGAGLADRRTSAALAQLALIAVIVTLLATAMDAALLPTTP